VRLTDDERFAWPQVPGEVQPRRTGFSGWTAIAIRWVIPRLIAVTRPRKIVTVALVAAILAAPAANAAPSPVHFTINSNAQYVSPTTILVPVSVTCPVGLVGFAFIQVQEQNLTNAVGFGFTHFTCSGSSQTLAIVVNGTGFTPGKAYATGSASPGTTFDQDTRQIQIVV
jgi:hypothetical protein